MTDGTTLVCPDEDCDSARLVRRIHTKPEWLCRTCRKEFSEPKERESESTGAKNGSLADKLIDGNPEDFGLSPMESD